MHVQSCCFAYKTYWFFLRSFCRPRRWILKSLIGSLSNANGKKAIGLHQQNNDSARTSRFFVHFFAVAARLRRRENGHANIPLVGNVKKWTQDNEFVFLYLIFDAVFKNLSPEEIGNIWRIERDGISVKFEAAQIHFFEWRFRSRRLRWCFNKLQVLGTAFRGGDSSFSLWITHLPPPLPILFFQWHIGVTCAWFHWSGSSWMEGAGLLAMAYNSSLSRDRLCQKKKPLDILGTRLH